MRFLLIFLGLMPGCAAVAQTVPTEYSSPPTVRAAFVAGFNAATQPTAKPATQPAPAPGDLLARAKSALPGAAIELSPGGSYLLSSSLDLLASQAALTFECSDPSNVATITCTAAATADSNIRLDAPHVTFRNVKILGSANVVYIRAPNCTFDNVQIGSAAGEDEPANGVKIDLGGDNFHWVNGGSIGPTRSVSIYIASVTGTNLEGTAAKPIIVGQPMGEYGTRMDIDLGGAANGGRMSYVYFTHPLRASKQDLGLRTGGGWLFDHCRLHNARINQVSKATTQPTGPLTPTDIFKNCTFDNPIVGNALSIDELADVQVLGCIFGPGCNTVAPPIAVMTGSRVTVSGNVQQVHKGETPKALVGLNPKANGAVVVQSPNTVQIVP